MKHSSQGLKTGLEKPVGDIRVALFNFYNVNDNNVCYLPEKKETTIAPLLIQKVIASMVKESEELS